MEGRDGREEGRPFFLLFKVVENKVFFSFSVPFSPLCIDSLLCVFSWASWREVKRGLCWSSRGPDTPTAGSSNDTELVPHLLLFYLPWLLWLMFSVCDFCFHGCCG